MTAATAKKDAASHVFHCKGGGSEGKGELVDEGFVVYEGSRARIHIVASAEDSVGPNRQKLIDAGVMEEQNGEYIFTEDYLFQSPSSAAAVVLGRSANGWVEWKDSEGLTLNEFYRNTENDAEQTD